MDNGKRIKREMRTVQAMLELYCRQNHNSQAKLCDQCQALLDYAHTRLAHCKFAERKPTCAKCPVHCYKPAMREQIKAVMKYSGPRMLYHHPGIAVRHILDGVYRKVD